MELNLVLALSVVLMSLFPTAFFYKKYRAAQSQLTIDQLTGVCSRFGFSQIATRVYNSHRRNAGTSMHLVYFDLDKFKRVNDENGHGFGDQVLAIFGRILLEKVRITDVVGRLGGDEFVALLIHPSGTDNFKIKTKMEKIRTEYEAAVRTLYSNKGKEMPGDISVSYGIVEHQIGKNTSLSQLVEEADRVLCLRKKHNGGR